jgi:hypothetical protein
MKTSFARLSLFVALAAHASALTLPFGFSRRSPTQYEAKPGLAIRAPILEATVPAAYSPGEPI